MCTQKTEIKREPNPPKINTSAFKRAPHGQRQSVKQPGKSASRCTEAFAGVAGSYHPDLSLSRSLLFLKWLWTIKQTPKKTSSEEPFFFYYVHILSATGFFLLERGMVHLRLLLGLKKREKRGGRGRKKKTWRKCHQFGIYQEYEIKRHEGRQSDTKTDAGQFWPSSDNLWRQLHLYRPARQPPTNSGDTGEEEGRKAHYVV